MRWILSLTEVKHLISVKCGDKGFIAGGDWIAIVNKKGKIAQEEIEVLSKKWWEYWKKYWQLRGTADAMKKDRACEITIPVSRENPQGYWW